MTLQSLGDVSLEKWSPEMVISSPEVTSHDGLTWLITGWVLREAIAPVAANAEMRTTKALARSARGARDRSCFTGGTSSREVRQHHVPLWCEPARPERVAGDERKCRAVSRGCHRAVVGVDDLEAGDVISEAAPARLQGDRITNPGLRPGQ